jgi:hypothetical protein
VGLVGLALVIGCAAERRPGSRFEAAHDATDPSETEVGDAWADGSVLEMLAPDEREAVRKWGVPGGDPEALGLAGRSEPAPRGGFAGAMDRAGKVGVTLLGVGLSAAAVAAPFFLF